MCGSHGHLRGNETPALGDPMMMTIDRQCSSGLMAVATAKSRRGLDEDLASSGLGGFFQASRTADEAQCKPHPQMVLDLLEELGVAAKDSLVIGDTTHDLWMAHNAGADAAAVLTGSHDKAELSRAEPLAYFEDLRELPPWLANGKGGD